MSGGDPGEVLRRPARPCDRTIRYGPGPDHVADVWLPDSGAGPARPPVVFLHGGFWMAEWDRAHVAPLAADLASRGYPVVTPEYRRVGQPGGGWPGTFDDVEAGVAAALARLELPVPVLGGHSAGGQLALWAASRLPCLGVLALAPVADLGRAHHLGLDGGAVDRLLGGGPDEVPERYATVDPARLLPLPVPVVVVHGTLDDRVPVGMAQDYVRAARARGGQARLVELPAVEHFGVIDPHSPAWPAVLSALDELAQPPGVAPGPGVAGTA